MAGKSEALYEYHGHLVEDPNYYHAGGFGLIYLGDVLNNRYKIFRKLGCGSFSTVWLAKDLVGGDYVAVKVHTAEFEYRVIERAHHPNVEFPLDHFVFESANGRHLCTILEPLGRSLLDVIDESFTGRDDSLERYERYVPHQWPLKFTRELCRQIIAGLDSLHSQGIAHRDIHPGNIAFAMPSDINSMSMDEIQQDDICWAEASDAPEEDNDWDAKNLQKHRGIIHVRRRDQKPLESNEIQCIVWPAPLHDLLVFDELPPFRALLIDLGDSRPFEDCNHPLMQPSNYRPPESILPIPVTHKADIFTAGLLIWEIIMHRNIVWTQWNKGEHDNNRYLKDLVRRIGPMPDHFEETFPQKDSDDEEELDEEDFEYGDMKFAARRDGPKEMTDAELEEFVDLMKQMMQWEPEKRATFKEVLNHAFFDAQY